MHFWKLAAACFTICIFSAFDAPFSRKIVDGYIETYKDIAIGEMRRTGIPASIKLAQGILESDFGRSPLATEARNHFGIKCGGDWTGNTYYILDDDTDSSGILIESCFRSFNKDNDSYIAHSEFLTNPAKKSRYGFLFSLPTTDYVGWANGLKMAGYASDPAYPKKLIGIIEKYQLYKYDEPIVKPVDNIIASNEEKSNPNTNPNTNTNTNTNTKPNPIKDSPIMDKASPKSSEIVKSKAKNAFINGLKMVYASGGETIQRIALMSGVKVSELMEYNEDIKSMDYVLKPNEIVYLERKKKNISGDNQFHTVEKGESMYNIAQQYGIRLESLLAKNNLTPDAIPMEGQEISLVKQLSKSQTPKFRQVERFDSYVDLGTLR